MCKILMARSSTEGMLEPVLVFCCWCIKWSWIWCLNNTNVLSYTSVGQKPDTSLTGSESRCQQGCFPLWQLQGRICFLAFSNCWRPPTFLGLFFPPSWEPAMADWVLLIFHHSWLPPLPLFCFCRPLCSCPLAESRVVSILRLAL